MRNRLVVLRRPHLPLQEVYNRQQEDQRTPQQPHLLPVHAPDSLVEFRLERQCPGDVQERAHQGESIRQMLYKLSNYTAKICLPILFTKL